MAADLVVAVAGGGAFFEIHAFEDRIFAVTLLHGEDGLLPPAFALDGLFIALRLITRLCHGEEIQLLCGLVFLRGIFLLQDTVRRDIDAAHGELRSATRS